MNYPDSVEYLYALGNEVKSVKLGLDCIRKLVEKLGNPQDAFRIIHVAGTNGKGSTCVMVEAGLRASGVRTGLFTSPHLVEPTERIRVAGADCTAEEFLHAFTEVHRVAEEMVQAGELESHPSYFETVTAMAFLLFREQHVQTAVIEVGLGGRLDATNVVSPEICVITPIDFDHENFLGSSIESIAGEKAGILKPGVQAVFARQRPEAEEVLQARANAMGARILRTAGHSVEELELSRDGSRFRYLDLELYCSLAGEHQVDNACTAALALQTFGVPDRAIEQGIYEARWPARLERVASNPDLILDGAHNPAGARALAAHIRRFYSDRKVWLIYGAMRDKAVDEITEILFPLAYEVILTAPDSARAFHPEALKSVSRHPRIRVAANIRSAIEAAKEVSPDDVIFITGSLYLTGEARALLVQ